MNNLFRKKWFVLAWPFITLGVSASLSVCFWLARGHEADWLTLLWWGDYFYLVVGTLVNFGKASIIAILVLFFFSIFCWFRRPGWRSLLFSLSVVCITNTLLAFCFYIVFRYIFRHISALWG